MNNRYKESSIKCEFCATVFSTWSAYQCHATADHPDDIRTKWMPCHDCDQLFPSKLSMATHTAKVHSNVNLRDPSGQLKPEPGLPDFSCYNKPKREILYQSNPKLPNGH
jgi:uncharacterized C2H2 Zn-finger protein